MAITAKFIADFTEFDRGVKTAQSNLVQFESAANKAGKQSEEFGYTLVKAAPAAKGLTAELKQFDSVLSSAGVNIGPAIRSITEIGEAATSSAGSLGKLAQAGLALGAGISAYNITRWALEFTGAADSVDSAVQRMVQSMTGFQAGAQEAAAKQDVLARASKTAGREITDYAQAIEINRKAAEQYGLTLGRLVNPAYEMRTQIAAWQKEIREANKAGNLQSLNEALDKQYFSLEKLSKMYGISVEALDYYKKKREDTFRAQEQQDQASAAANARRVAEAEKAAAAEQKFAEDRFNQQLKLDQTLRAENEKMIQSRLREVNEAVAAQAIAHAQYGQILMDEAIKEEQLRWQIEATTKARQYDNQAYIEAAQARQSQGLGPFTSLPDLTGGPMSDAMRRQAMLAQTYQSSASGVGALEAAYRAAGIFIPGGGAARALQGVNITINGSVLGNKDEIARVVGDAVTSSYRSGGNRLPA